MTLSIKILPLLLLTFSSLLLPVSSAHLLASCTSVLLLFLFLLLPSPPTIISTLLLHSLSPSPCSLAYSFISAWFFHLLLSTSPLLSFPITTNNYWPALFHSSTEMNCVVTSSLATSNHGTPLPITLMILNDYSYLVWVSCSEPFIALPGCCEWECGEEWGLWSQKGWFSIFVWGSGAHQFGQNLLPVSQVCSPSSSITWRSQLLGGSCEDQLRECARCLGDTQQLASLSSWMRVTPVCTPLKTFQSDVYFYWHLMTPLTWRQTSALSFSEHTTVSQVCFSVSSHRLFPTSNDHSLPVFQALTQRQK